jgi:iron(III) transport system substrate-binding protein
MTYALVRRSGLALLLAVMAAVLGCRQPAKPTVVVYTSVDQVYAEPILNDFGTRTGIDVRALYDVEASKTSGLVNRLIAEAKRPQADVFWNGEFSQTLDLRDRGVLAEYSFPAANRSRVPAVVDPDRHWATIGGRARVLLVNTSLVPLDKRPTSIRELLGTTWPADRVGIAHPLFGTSFTQAAALYAALGRDSALEFYRSLRTRGVRVVDGNAVVRDMVVSGQLMVGWTDSDDACGAVTRGAPVAVVVPDQDSMGTLVVPETVALIAGAPHPNEASRLIDYLVSMDVERRLVDIGFAQAGTMHSGVRASCLPPTEVRAMRVSFADIARQVSLVRDDLGAVFVR